MESKYDEVNFNPNFYCPITDELMVDPVIDHEGNSYERSAIEAWLKRNPTSPITRVDMSISDLTPNRALKSAIEIEKAAGKTLITRINRDKKGTEPEKKDVEFRKIPIEAKLADLNLIDEVSFQVNAYPKDTTGASGNEEVFLVHCSAKCADIKVRVPADICCVVDVSGSMGTEASIAGAESGGLCMLDIVMHAVLTIINTLGNEDRMSLVSYSNSGKVVFELINMTTAGKAKATELLRTLKPDGMTNLWDGLQKGLDVLRDGSYSRVPGANSSVLLLTDGVPNVEPPRGYVAMLQKYRERCGGKMPGTINTFGFGYQLNSGLLKEIAIAGVGAYSFIPDSGMVGTAFVNTMASVLSTAAKDVVLRLETMSGSRFNGPPLGNLSIVHTNDGDIVVDVGSLQSGQSKDVVVEIALPSVAKTRGASLRDYVQEGPYLVAKLGYTDKDNVSKIITKEAEVDVEDAASGAVADVVSQRLKRARRQAELASQRFRLCVVQTLDSLVGPFRMGFPSIVVDRGVETMQNLIVEMREWLTGEGQRLRQGQTSANEDSSPWSRIASLLKDLEGQVSEACSRPDWFAKWGVHYIPSLARAHQLQQCNNFKDPGIQTYGGDIFRETRDMADDVFCQLPPPVPTAQRVAAVRATAVGAPAPVLTAARVDMSSFNNRDNPCFHGSCRMRMADGSFLFVNAIKAGDLVALDSDGNAAARVECVVVTEIDEGVADLVEIVSDSPCGSMLVTPWHPVSLGGRWTFPVDVDGAVCSQRPCSQLFSFVLAETDGGCGVMKRGSSVVVGGVKAAALAHGVVGDAVLSHDFFGTESVVTALLRGDKRGYSTGLIKLRQGCMTRDKPGSNVCGISPSHFVTVPSYFD